MNAILPLAELETYQFPLVQSCIFPKMVSTSHAVREASATAEKKLDSHFSQCRKREDVYRVVKAFSERGEWLGLESKHYIQSLVGEFERNGANLALSQRMEMESLRSQIDELSLKYIENFNCDNSFLLISEPELAGMPPQFIKSLDKTEDAKLKVFLRAYHVSPILDHCKVGSTRKLIAVAYGQRCGKENLEVLENLVQMRHKYARLLGYSNYADFAIEPRMARTSAKVLEFLENVSAYLTAPATTELVMLKDLKKKEEGDSPFGTEDLLYYMKRAEEQQFDLDLGEVKQYFPVNLVLSGIVIIFQDLFGLRFEEVKDVEIPVALLVSQCPKNLNEEPELLRFSEVVTLFHEFSHVVHQICNRATFSRFSGLSLEPDFVEIPGQVLENWCYESTSLKMMSGFHQDITKPITNEMCKSLKRRRDMFSALKLKQEILLCLLDQIMHSRENVDAVELLKHLHPKIMLGLPLLEGTNPASCFTRFAIGYEASCYSYIWSEAFAADIFASKFQDDMLNQYAGVQFRNKVLAPGGARDPLEILSDYLGREPSIQPFIESKTRNSL